MRYLLYGRALFVGLRRHLAHDFIDCSLLFAHVRDSRLVGTSSLCSWVRVDRAFGRVILGVSACGRGQSPLWSNASGSKSESARSEDGYSWRHRGMCYCPGRRESCAELLMLSDAFSAFACQGPRLVTGTHCCTLYPDSLSMVWPH